MVGAHINESGIEKVLDLANEPQMVTEYSRSHNLIANNRWSSIWIPGLTIPGVEFLDKPFAVQIQGDIEPFSITTTWRPGSKDCKEVEFTGYLTASDVSTSGDDMYKLRKVRRSFDSVSRYGGFLNIVLRQAEVEYGLYDDEKEGVKTELFVTESDASFFINESEDDHNDIYNLMINEGLNPNNIISVIKFKRLFANHQKTTSDIPILEV